MVQWTSATIELPSHGGSTVPRKWPGRQGDPLREWKTRCRGACREDVSPTSSRRIETADVDIDNQTPVAEGIDASLETRFSGKINKITLEVSPVK